ncbi:F0F1 ATP synthase subunit alpha, partial [Leptospira santarosai]
VEEQVVEIFAVTRGFMDKIPVAKVQEYGKFLLNTIREKYSEVLEAIRKEKKISDEEKLGEVLASVAEEFLRKH